MTRDIVTFHSGSNFAIGKRQMMVKLSLRPAFLHILLLSSVILKTKIFQRPSRNLKADLPYHLYPSISRTSHFSRQPGLS